MTRILFAQTQFKQADALLDAPEEQGIPPSSEPDRSPSPYRRSYPVVKSSPAEYPGTDVMMTGLMQDISPGVYDDRGRHMSDRGESANIRLIMKPRGDNTPNASPAMPPGASHPTFPSNANGHSYRRSRPQTTHQKAVDINRKMRVEHIMHQQLVEHHATIRRQKRRRGMSFGYTAMKRIRDMPDDYDTEDDRFGTPGGLVPNLGESEDYGEDALRQKKALDRAIRRLERGDNGLRLNGLIRVNVRRKRKHQRSDSDDELRERAFPRAGKQEDDFRRPLALNEVRLNDRANEQQGRRQGNGTKQEEGLDDLDLDLLGEARDGEHGEEELEEDSGLDDTEGEGNELSE